MFCDYHAHLDAPYFTDKLPEVLDRACQAGVEQIVTIGVTPASSRNCIRIAAQYSNVYASVAQ